MYKENKKQFKQRRLEMLKSNLVEQMFYFKEHNYTIEEYLDCMDSIIEDTSMIGVYQPNIKIIVDLVYNNKLDLVYSLYLIEHSLYKNTNECKELAEFLANEYIEGQKSLEECLAAEAE